MSNFSIAVEPEAADDLVTAFDWYEEQLVGLGQEFLISVQVSFAQIERNPEMYQTIDQRIRRARIERFPFGIFYDVRPAKVHVIAVMHSRRDPEGWQERLKQREAR